MSVGSPFFGRRVLVTGAAGFLGRHLCRRLASCGAEVDGVGRGSQPRDVDVHRWRQVDCTVPSAVRDAFEAASPEFVFHLAGHADARRGLDLVLPTLRGDLVTAINVLTAATELKCRRVVMAGSLEVPDPRESDPIPSSPYAAAKWAGTVYARMFHNLYRTPVVLGRVFMTYGPGQRAHKLIPYVVDCLLHDMPPMIAGGDRAVDWIYVDDTVEGLMALASAEGIEGEILDIGSGSLVSIREVVDQLTALSGSEARPAYGALTKRLHERIARADIEQTHSRTGWRPQVPLTAGLAETIAWYRKQDRPLVPEEKTV